MKGTVEIGGKGIDMIANAASIYIYRQIFKEDFLLKAQEKHPDADIFSKMGFIMAKQAQTDKMSELMATTIDEYYEWLVQFEPLDLLNAAGEISNLYIGQEAGLSTPKQKDV